MFPFEGVYNKKHQEFKWWVLEGNKKFFRPTN
jgi:hypothetical protein